MNRRPFLGLLVAAALLAGLEGAVRLNLSRIREYDLRDTLLMRAKPAAYAAQPAPDLCLVGTSETDQGLSAGGLEGAEVLGVRVERAFNFGVNRSPVNTWATVRAMLRTDRLPKAVLHEVSLCDLSRSEDDSMLADLPASDAARLWRLTRRPEQAWSWLVGRVERGVLERVSLLYRYREALESFCYDALARLSPAFRANAVARARAARAARQAFAVRPDGDRTLDLGKRTLLERLSDPLYRPVISGCRDARLDAASTRIFEDAVDSLLARGVRVALYTMPVAAAGESAKGTPESRRAFQDYIAAFSRGRGLAYLAPSRERCGLTDADYLDPNHLLEPGQRKLTRCVRELAQGRGRS